MKPFPVKVVVRFLIFPTTVLGLGFQTGWESWYQPPKTVVNLQMSCDLFNSKKYSRVCWGFYYAFFITINWTVEQTIGLQFCLNSIQSLLYFSTICWAWLRNLLVSLLAFLAWLLPHSALTALVCLPWHRDVVACNGLGRQGQAEWSGCQCRVWNSIWPLAILKQFWKWPAKLT